MKNIGIIGATGNAGAAIYQEALKRGHEVTAIVRNQEKAKALLGNDAKLLVKDAFDLAKADLEKFDVVVNAFATEPKKAYLHVDLAAKLIHLFRETTSPRLFFIVGAGSLETGEDHHLVVKDIEKMPDSEAWVAIPQNQLIEYQFLKTVENVNWVAISPGFTFQAGALKPALLGENTLLRNKKGDSVTSSETLAKAIVDEIENEHYHQTRFTVIDDE